VDPKKIRAINGPTLARLAKNPAEWVHSARALKAAADAVWTDITRPIPDDERYWGPEATFPSGPWFLLAAGLSRHQEDGSPELQSDGQGGRHVAFSGGR
jgi:hypothetical protein